MGLCPRELYDFSFRGFCPMGLCPGGFCLRGFCPTEILSSRGFCLRGFCPRFIRVYACSLFHIFQEFLANQIWLVFERKMISLPDLSNHPLPFRGIQSPLTMITYLKLGVVMANSRVFFSRISSPPFERLVPSNIYLWVSPLPFKNILHSPSIIFRMFLECSSRSNSFTHRTNQAFYHNSFRQLNFLFNIYY